MARDARKVRGLKDFFLLLAEGDKPFRGRQNEHEPLLRLPKPRRELLVFFFHLGILLSDLPQER